MKTTVTIGRYGAYAPNEDNVIILPPSDPYAKSAHQIADEISDHLIDIVRKSFAETKKRLDMENAEKIKQLEKDVASYKKLCLMADVPQIFIDHPTLVECQELTHKDIELARTWMMEYQNKKAQ